MARPHRIWWWKQKGEFAVDIDGKRHRLGADRDEAERQMHALLAKQPEEKPAKDAALAVMDTFLEEATFKAERTRDWYLRHCQCFTDWLKGHGLKGLKVGELAPHHVNKWIKAHKEWADGTKNGACRAVQRAFRWANQMGYIKVNPLAFIPDKPSPGRRENIITQAEYEEILSDASDEIFRDLLVVSWECGCRPQESLRVEKRHVNETLMRWEFPVGEGKKTRKKVVRYVYLTENALAITRKLMLKYPEGPLFRNRKGRPWTVFAVNCRFIRMKGKIGRKVALYDFRHSFTERLRQAGIDSVNIAALLGHADLSMLGRTYAHPHTAPTSLLEELRKATPSGAASAGA